jgi:hypothetical protein
VPAPVSNHFPQGITVTTVEMWRKYAYLRNISTGEDRAKQKAFKSASEHLIAAGEATAWGEYVWAR